MEREDFILKSIERKLDIIGQSQMSDEEIQKAFTPDELNLIEKAKYIRREGVKGNYKYIYEEPKGKESSLNQKDKINEELEEARKKLRDHSRKMDRLSSYGSGFSSFGREEYNKMSKEEDRLRDEVRRLEKQQSEKKEEPKLSESSKAKVLKVVKYLKKHGLTTTTNEVNSAADGSDEILSPKEIDAVRYYFDKSEDTDIEKAETGEKKVAKVMKEFKEGKLKTSAGKVVTDRDQAIAIALSEAGLSKGEEEKEDDVEKGGEGSRGGKIIGHTKSGKPIYEGGEHHKVMESHFNFSSSNHSDKAKRLRIEAAKLKKQDQGKSSGQQTTIRQKELERKAKIHDDLAHIKSSKH